MNGKVSRVAVFGASGHGKVVVDAINKHPLLQVAIFADDNPELHNSYFHGQILIVDRESLLSSAEKFAGIIVAIGVNSTRMSIAKWLQGQGFRLMTVVHPAAIIAESVELGGGTLVMPGAVINACSEIGENVIINSGVIVEHDCSVGNGVHLAPGVVLCGNVTIGEGAFVGAGTVVVPGVKIAPDSFIKAGTIVKRDWGSN
jgi:sugar O-acyltransferase (sialic acid O-acetyltransferase NeuD family)